MSNNLKSGLCSSATAQGKIPETADIVITTASANKFAARHSDYAPLEILDSAEFAGVSDLANHSQCGPIHRDSLAADGWTAVLNAPYGVPHSKRVTISLPEGVHSGRYFIGNYPTQGIWSDHEAHDGMGKTVYVLSDTVRVVDGDRERAIDNVIQLGLRLSVPAGDGKRAIIPVKILAVSELF